MVYSGMMEFHKKIDRYTEAKCQYERNMETCILEQLYFTNKSKSIIAELKDLKNSCYSEAFQGTEWEEENQGTLKSKGSKDFKQRESQFLNCYKEKLFNLLYNDEFRLRQKINGSQKEFEVLKTEIQAMIEVSKRELLKS